MKKKLLVIMICMLLITTVASISASAIKCDRKPATHTVKQNSPPDNPTVEIPENVVIGHWIYIKTITTDPENDNVYYKYDIDGHDYGWVGPFQSGKEHVEKIMVIVPVGTYILGVQAKDVYGAESDCTYTLFNVLKQKSVSSSFLNFLNSHSNLFLLLRYILRL
jgi:hypothetical protein